MSGMVASSQTYASEAGAQVLRDGGTAADACVAMDAVLHVTEPTSTGLGGDAFARHGSMPMARLLAPAVALAAEGFAVGAVTAAAWARGLPQLRSAELTLDGRAPRAGERFRNPALARTLRRIADGGADAFYRGEI